MTRTDPSFMRPNNDRTSSLGKYTLPLVLQVVDDMTTVSDADLSSTMNFVWTRLKLVV